MLNKLMDNSTVENKSHYMRLQMNFWTIMNIEKIVNNIMILFWKKFKFVSSENVSKNLN